MYEGKIHDLDVVRLKNGQVGTIVYIHEDWAFCVEVDEELVDATRDDIVEVTWTRSRDE